VGSKAHDGRKKGLTKMHFMHAECKTALSGDKYLIDQRFSVVSVFDFRRSRVFITCSAPLRAPLRQSSRDNHLSKDRDGEGDAKEAQNEGY